jgi:hypothetical protein
MTGIYGFSFTLPQVISAMEEAYEMGRRDQEEDVDASSSGMENLALIICETANLPMLDVLSALQRLEEWRSSQRDHP